MASSTVENYIKHLYLLSQGQERDALVPMGEIAHALEVTPGTATTMIKTLAESGMVVYEPRVGGRLSGDGEALALRVLRRHRLVELFLVRTLGMDWSEIHDEAEELEHAISDRLLERIDRLLGRPTIDPHGDPIPSAQGEVRDRGLVQLPDAPDHTDLEIGRIADQGEAFLQFAEQNGLMPDQIVRLSNRDDVSGVVSIELEDGRRLSIGLTAAAKIEVKVRGQGVVG